MPYVYTDSLQAMTSRFFDFIPQLLGALVILIIGVIVAVALSRIMEKLLSTLQLDAKMERIGVGQYVRKADPQLSISKMISWVVKWVIILLTLIAVTESLGLTQITDFLNTVILYIPNVIAAVAILLIGIMAGGFIERVLGASLRAMNMKAAEVLATFAKWSVVVFAVMIALVQLGIAPTIINTLVTGFVGMVALAGGLAFGLGGQEVGKELLNKLKSDLQHHA